MNRGFSNKDGIHNVYSGPLDHFDNRSVCGPHILVPSWFLCIIILRLGPYVVCSNFRIQGQKKRVNLTSPVHHLEMRLNKSCDCCHIHGTSLYVKSYSSTKSRICRLPQDNWVVVQVHHATRKIITGSHIISTFKRVHYQRE